MNVTEQCKRNGDHAWDPPELDENMERPQVCSVCGTRRFTARDGAGNLMARHYEYQRPR